MLLRLPSVTTWMQSSLRVVMGHLHSAPERFVPGCKFWSSGAPTSNLFFPKQITKKKMVKCKYIIQIWQELHFLCVYIRIDATTKRDALKREV